MCMCVCLREFMCATGMPEPRGLEFQAVCEPLRWTWGTGLWCPKPLSSVSSLPVFYLFCFAFNVSLLTFSNKLLGRDLGNWVAGSKALTQNMFRGTWVNVLTGGYEWGLPSQGEWTVTSRAWVWRMFAHFCLHSVLTSHMEDAHYLSRARGKSSLPLDLGALPFIHWYHTQSVR